MAGLCTKKTQRKKTPCSFFTLTPEVSPNFFCSLAPFSTNPLSWICNYGVDMGFRLENIAKLYHSLGINIFIVSYRGYSPLHAIFHCLVAFCFG